MDDITLYGNEVLPEVREYMYAEAEMTVSYNLIQDYFFNLMDSFRDENIYYAEADDEGESEVKVGFFKRIGMFFKKMYDAIIKFIKNVARKTWEILSKPFSFKMNKANNSPGGGGGGGSSTPTQRTEGSTNVDSNISNMSDFSSFKELGILRTNLVKYLNSKATPKTESVSQVGLHYTDSDVKNALLINKINSGAEYTAVAKAAAKLKNSCIAHMDLLYSFDDDKQDLTNVNKDMYKGNIFKDVPKHEIINVKYESIGKKEEDVRAGISAVLGIANIINKLVECTNSVVGVSNQIQNKTSEDEIKKEIVALITGLISSNNSKNIDFGSNIKPDTIKAFGTVDLTLFARYVNIFYVYIFPKDALHLKNDFEGTVQVALGKETPIKIDAYETNKNILKGKIIDKDLDKMIFEVVNIKADGNKTESITDYLSKVFMTGVTYKALRKPLLDALKILQDLDTKNKADKDGRTKLDDISKENKATKASQYWKDMVTASATTIKSIATQVPQFMRLITRIDTAITIGPHMYNSLVCTSAIASNWDTSLFLINKCKDALEHNKKVQEDLGLDKDYTGELKNSDTYKKEMAAIEDTTDDVLNHLKKTLKEKR